MTIYILDNDPVKCAQYLDDRSLYSMIRNIAQVLCNVHWEIYWHEGRDVYGDRCLPPIKYLLAEKNKSINEWSQWARECVSNYKYLVNLLHVCAHEYRFIRDISINIKLGEVIAWVRENQPDLPLIGTHFPNKYTKTYNINGDKTPFPLVMPDKYLIRSIYDFNNPLLIHTNVIESYRNYYQSKLSQRLKGQLLNRRLQCQLWTRVDKPDWLTI